MEYRRLYRNRNTGSIIPSDYCFNRDNKGNQTYPRFLIWDGGNQYTFVGLNGRGDASGVAERANRCYPNVGRRCDESPVTKRELKRPADAETKKPASRNLLFTTRFLPHPSASLALDPELARLAIRLYNNDPAVEAQERAAFAALGSGFRRGEVERQLIALDRTYSTRSLHADLGIIASRIEDEWNQWSSFLESARDLEESVPDADAVRELLRLFLNQLTRRRPRSLATKALHFAAPRTFCPVDSYAADKLGAEHGAGCWNDTSGLLGEGMAIWYMDYLTLVHKIGRVNRGLIRDLVKVDTSTGEGAHHERLRGLPKIVDKILWWAGREVRRGETVRLFPLSRP